MITLFNPLSIDEQAGMLAHHIPIGRAWESAFDGNSNIGKLIVGLGIEFYRLQLQTQQIATEMDINQTLELITEWERSVGIPDDCLGNDGNIADRRINVLQKFSNFGGVQKKEDFERVAALYGFDVTIKHPSRELATFPIEFPLPFFGNIRDATHTIFVEIADYEDSEIGFPIEFPILFSDGGTSFLQCIFDLLAPANVKVVFVPEGTIV